MTRLGAALGAAVRAWQNKYLDPLTLKRAALLAQAAALAAQHFLPGLGGADGAVVARVCGGRGGVVYVGACTGTGTGTFTG